MENFIVDLVLSSEYAAWAVAILTVVGAIVSTATVVAPLTKTTVDDRAVAWWERTAGAKFKSIVEKLSVLPNKPKQE